MELIEATGAPLFQRLQTEGVLGSADAPVDIAALYRILLKFDITIIGRRAIERTGCPTLSVLCTCQRAAYRGVCQHRIFVECLTFAGIREASRRMQNFVVQPPVSE